MNIKTFFIIIFLIISNQGFSQLFTEQTDIVITGINEGSVNWGDYNNDGLLDFMMTGRQFIDGEDFSYYAAIFKNLGSNIFEEYTGVIQPVERSSLEWGDYNNDNYLDIIYGGGYIKNYSSFLKTEICKNNTNETFSVQTDINLIKTTQCGIAWGDYNNDAYQDIFQTGYNYGNVISKIYKNNQNNNFIEQTDINIKGVDKSSVSWGDYNNDGFLDFVYNGNTGYFRLTKIYKNNGNNTFSVQNNIELVDLSAGTIEWGDYNNDGFLDLIMSGQTLEDQYNVFITKIYRNNGDNTFTELLDVDLVAVTWSSVIWGDYNNDGFLDILLTGWAADDIGTGICTSKIYKNNGDETFTEQIDISLIPVGYSSVAWGDYDNDNDLDILLSGVYAASSLTTKIYKNNITIPNTPPNIITNLQTEIVGNDIIFSWDEATDDNQASAGLSYNIYVYEKDNPLPYIASPQAFSQTHDFNGRRLIAERGHIQGIRENGRVSYIIKGRFEKGKTYYWSVQAIDASFAGGEFAPEATINIVNIPKITDNAIKIYPNPASNYIQINTEIKNIKTVEIYDIYGNLIKKQETTQPKTIINVSSLTTGLYFIKLFNENKIIQTSKLIIY